MNLFTARLTGRMLSTEQFEKTIYDMQERVKRWRQIEKSPELEEYKQLKAIIESSDFQERKKELSDRKYQDTDENLTDRGAGYAWEEREYDGDLVYVTRYDKSGNKVCNSERGDI